MFEADDRRPGEFPTDPLADVATTLQGRFESTQGARPTVTSLRAMWRERDERYATARLDAGQVRAIRAFRVEEVRALDPVEAGRAAIAIEALTWAPPKGGGK